MEQLIQILRRHALDRFVFCNQPLVHHFDRTPHRRHSGPLRATRLQHVQLAVLERELHVLHVFEVLLEFGRQAVELAVDLGEFAALHSLDRLGRTCAGDHVLALRVGQHVAVQHMLAGAAVARECHARAAVVAHVAIDHGDDVHGGSQAVRNAVDLAVVLGTFGVPALEDRFNRAPQLFLRIVREGMARALLHDRLEVVHQVVQVVRGQIDVAFDLAACFGFLELFFERSLADVVHDVAVHRHEASIGVVGKARILGAGDETFDRPVVEAEVENRLHHSRHRDGGARTHRDEQGILAVAEPLFRDALEVLQVPIDFGAQCGRKRAVFEVRDAELGGERESGRDRQSQVGHLGEAGAFAAEDVAHGGGAIGATVAEEVDVALNGHTAIMEPEEVRR